MYFFRLLSDAKLYAADENVNKINDVFYPIVKLVREENINEPIDYFTGNPIQIFKNDKLIENISKDELIGFSQILFKHIVSGDNSSQGSFDVPDLREFLKKLKINKIKASSQEKSDINVQLRDIYTGFTSLVGFSIKSDVGSPSTLLNAGKNTRIRYVVKGLSKESVEEINSIDKNSEREYMKARMVKLFEQAESITFDKVLDETFNDNLIMIDSLLPCIYGEMILLHYKYINNGINDCEELLKLLDG
ncbi:MAG: HpaII family restriction endonuclease [Succinivibrionaceae bacterium]|nr:HpaII family restriction endonuclease [Succinivibrionaceae bacterium]